MRQRHSDDSDVVDLNLLGQGKWEKICGTQDTVVEVFGHIRLMTLDTLMKCTFSQETNCQINSSVTCIHSPNKYLLRLYFVPDIFLEAGNIVMNKQTTVPLSLELGPCGGKEHVYPFGTGML